MDVSDAPVFSSAEIEAGRALFAREWHFVSAADSPPSLPAERGVEIAFAGRSNVGKSSLINALVGQGGLARTSNTPGRTQELLFFAADGTALKLVDMPGYGYAAAPKQKIKAWTGGPRLLAAPRQSCTRLRADRRASRHEGYRSTYPRRARRSGGEPSDRADQGGCHLADQAFGLLQQRNRRSSSARRLFPRSSSRGAAECNIELRATIARLIRTLALSDKPEFPRVNSA